MTQQRTRYMTRTLLYSRQTTDGGRIFKSIRLIIPTSAQRYMDVTAMHLAKATPPGMRWITVHPNGKEEKGVPLLIKESTDEPGSFYVVGGAGGKMNHMKLTGVKSKEQAEAEAKVRRKEKQQEKKKKEQELAELGLTDQKKAIDAAIEAAHMSKATERIKQKLHDLAPMLGKDISELTFPPKGMTREAIQKLDELGPSSAQYKMAEYQYYQKIETSWDKQIEAELKRTLLQEQEALEKQGISFTQIRDKRSIEVAEALAQEGKKRGEVAELDDKIEAAKAVGWDDEAIANLEAQREGAQEELDQYKEIIEKDQAAPLTIDEASGRKTKSGAGYDNRTKSRAVQAMIENGTLHPDGLAALAADDLEGQGILKNIGTIMSHGNLTGAGGGGLQAAQIDMAKRGSLLQEAADLARNEDYDGAYTKWKQAETLLAKWERRVENAQNRPPESKMTPGDYLDFVGNAIQEGRERARTLSEASKAGATTIPEDLKRAQIQHDKVRELLATKKRHDALKASSQRAREELKRQASEAGYQIDTDAINDKFNIDDMSDEAALAAADKAIDIERMAMINGALLQEVEESPELLNQLDLSRVELQKAMGQHVSSGAYAGFGNATLLGTGDALIDRGTIDMLGVKGAASVLAAHLKATLDDERFHSLREGLENFHGDHSTDQAAQALADAKDAYAEAKNIAFGDMEHASDPVHMQYLNDQRRDLLESTMHKLGHTIGTLRAQAELINAMKNVKAPDPNDSWAVAIPMGKTTEESVIGKMAANGINRDEYTMGYDKDNKTWTLQVAASAIGKICRSDLSQDELNAAGRAQNIKTGMQDEGDWLPTGIARRPKTTFENNAPAPRQFSIEPDFHGKSGAALHEHVADVIGSRVADGEPIDTVVSNLMSHEYRTQHTDPKQGAAIDKAIMSLVPQYDPAKHEGVEGMRRLRQEREGVARDLAEQFRERNGLSGSLFHTQGIDTDSNEAIEAVHRALAAVPAATVAYKSGMDLTAQDKNALRNHWWKSISPEGQAESTAAKKREQSQKQAAKQAEESGRTGTDDMFGGMFGADDFEVDERLHKEYGPNDVIDTGDKNGRGEPIMRNAREWQAEKRRAMGLDGPTTNIYGSETGHDGDMGGGSSETAARHAWDRYLQAHGNNPAAAYRSIQEHVQGQFHEQFANAYGGVAGQSLKTGKAAFTDSEAHRIGLTSADRFADEMERARNPERSEQARQGQGAGGRFVSGSRREAANAVIGEQQRDQRALFEDDSVERTDKAPERTSLGDRLERQLGSMVNSVSDRWDASADPSKLFPISMGDYSDQGKKFFKQQRAVKLTDHQPKLGLWFGAGSGKSLTTLAMYTHAESQGKATRAIYAVPSAVQAQFAGEATKFLDPSVRRRDGRRGYKWHASPGASREERHAAYQDPDTDFVVKTHEGITGDILHAVGEHQGMPRDAVTGWFNGLSREKRAEVVKDAMAHAGWHGFDMLYVDEAHLTANRKGKANATKANVLDALGDNMKLHVLGSGTPVKNDASEAFDMLSKLDPNRFNDRSDFMRRYGGRTESQKQALQRLTSRYFYQDRVESGVNAKTIVYNGRNGNPPVIPLTPPQQAQFNAARQAFNSIKLEREDAKKQGRPVDMKKITQHMRVLSPNSFEGLPAARHEDKARELMSAAGVIREAAYHRIINGGKFETNGKMQHILKLANDFRNQSWTDKNGVTRKGKPGVIFARNLEAVHELRRGLEAAGHRVATLTGEQTSEEKDKARQAFWPDSKRHEDATADILILSDAGNTGLNLQRGQWLAHVDTPMTGPVFEQRNARIDRVGQENDVEVHHLLSNTPYDGEAERRLNRKLNQGKVWQDPSHALSDNDLAAYVNQAYEGRTGKARMLATATGDSERKAGRRAAVEAGDAAKREANRKRALKRAGNKRPVLPEFHGEHRPKEVIAKLEATYKPHVPVQDWPEIQQFIRSTVGSHTDHPTSQDWAEHANTVAQAIHETMEERGYLDEHEDSPRPQGVREPD